MARKSLTLLSGLIMADSILFMLGIALRDEGDTDREIYWESSSNWGSHYAWLFSNERMGSQAPPRESTE